MTDVSRATKTEQDICDAVDRLRPELIRITSDLVRFRTLRLTGESFVDCATYLREEYERAGLDVATIPVPESEMRRMSGPDSHYRRLGLEGDLAPRMNVLGTTRAADASGPSLHINGHFCVVEPVDGWSADPFVPRLVGDQIIGRGASDMKGGLATTIVALRALTDAGVVPGGPVFVSATIDTHFGGDLGAGYIARHGLGRADRVIVTDTSGPSCVLLGYRGQLWLELVVSGRAAHGSLAFEGVDPVPATVAAISAMLAHRDLLGARVSRHAIEPEGARIPTLTVGSMLSSGAMINQVPSECRVGIDRRLIPDENPEDVEAELQAVLEPVRRDYPEASIRLIRLFAASPTVVDQDDPLVTGLAHNIERVTGAKAKTIVHPAFPDLQWFTQSWGVPGVVYGPGEGGAATGFDRRPYTEPDEGILVSSMTTCAKVLAMAIVELTDD